ncbi:MAG: GNAT family N-acetyltransferase, partial [Actinomycetota bacterium]
MPKIPGIDIFELSFRTAVHSDVHKVADLVNSAYRGELSKLGWTNEADIFDGERTNAKELAKLIDADDSLILLCLHESEIVGSVHLEKVEGGAYLGMLAVNPSLQRAGIGKRFMEKAERVACEVWNCRKVSMTVVTIRHELIQFYERLGYRRTGKIDAIPPNSWKGT